MAKVNIEARRETCMAVEVGLKGECSPHTVSKALYPRRVAPVFKWTEIHRMVGHAEVITIFT
jgi:hypothetical protein